jgi:hypothetical protein
LIRVSAAAKPIEIAKRGSRDLNDELDIRYIGPGERADLEMMYWYAIVDQTVTGFEWETKELQKIWNVTTSEQ